MKKLQDWIPELNENQLKLLERLLVEHVIEPLPPINLMVKAEHATQETSLKEFLYGEKLLTSEDWSKQLAAGVEILDPDGWDRKNWDYSWCLEKITKREFERRFAHSTVQMPRNTGIWQEQADDVS